MIHAGRHSNSLLLKVLFAAWVLAPFAALIWAGVVSIRWPIAARHTLWGLMLVVAAGSLAAYGHDVLSPPRSQAAAVFVMVPLVSWVVIAALALLVFRRRPRHARDE